MKNALDVLRERGFVKQTVFEEDLYKLLGEESVCFYNGFDPTADSLHIGSYIPFMGMAHLQRCGHKPIILVGGGTAMVGDPSGKNDMRKMDDRATIVANAVALKKQMSRFLSFEGQNAAVIIDNYDWLGSLNYIDFLRDIGVYFSVNKMLTAECFKQRMEKGLSLFELNYMVMQGYDFLHLFRHHNCVMQTGGNDQWSNMLAGADLIRRKEGKDAFVITFPLLETSDGVKMGKTQKGALWLDENKTTPYEFFQYFRNIEDVKVRECMCLLTFMDLQEIDKLCEFADERINAAKERLAWEITKLIHGQAAADDCLRQARAAFSGNDADMPCVKCALPKDTLVVDLLVEVGVCASKSEVRRLIDGKAIKLFGTTLQGYDKRVCDFLQDGFLIVHRGKKVHLRIDFD